MFVRQRNLRIAVARKIHEVKAAINAIEVYGLGSARGVAGEGKPLLSRYRIDKTGFTDIASPQKSYLGHPVGGEVLGFICAKDEF